MKDPCSSVSELLERYFDREVTDQEKVLVEAHLADCSRCKKALRSMEVLGNLMKVPAEAYAREEELDRVLMKIKRKLRSEEYRPWWQTFRSRLIPDVLLQKRVWIPAAAATLILILAVTPLIFNKGASYSIPTVVEYVESDTNNVMIYESEKGNVTVIWVIEDTETTA